MPDIIQRIIDFLGTHWGWVAQFAVVWITTWLISFLVQKILRKNDSHQNTWRSVVIASVSLPLRIFIWIGGATTALHIIQPKVQHPLIQTLLDMQPSLHTLIIGWFALRFTKHSSRLMAIRHSSLSAGQLDTAQKFISVVLVLAVVMLILPNFGISIGGLLAFGGIGGVIMGLASKDMLTNVFGAVMIYFDRPFAVGDWVYLPDKDMNGTVEHIGWRQVTVRTFDKRLVFIPNAMFGNVIVMNPSKMTHRRIYETIGVRYQDINKIPAILEDIRDHLQSNPSLDQSSGMVAHLDKFNAYSVDILVSAFSTTTDWAAFLAIKEKVLLAIHSILHKHGAEFAFPTQLVYMEKPSPDSEPVCPTSSH